MSFVLHAMIKILEYISLEKVDCFPKIREYPTLLEAMMACSRDDDCGSVSQSCGAKEEAVQKYFTCAYSPFSNLTYEDCKSLVLYQKSKL